MNIVDSSGWLAYHVDGLNTDWTPDADFAQIKGVQYIEKR